MVLGLLGLEVFGAFVLFGAHRLQARHMIRGLLSFNAFERFRLGFPTKLFLHQDLCNRPFAQSVLGLTRPAAEKSRSKVQNFRF